LPSSEHAVPSGAFGFEQPTAGSQIPPMWHWSSREHATGGPPHSPPSQASFVVHGFPSLHDEPSGAGAMPHAPVSGSQTPESQLSPAGQTTTAELPNKIVTMFETWISTARSGLPSRLKSAATTEPG
jgi:hypothetical protein